MTAGSSRLERFKEGSDAGTLRHTYVKSRCLIRQTGFRPFYKFSELVEIGGLEFVENPASLGGPGRPRQQEEAD